MDESSSPPLVPGWMIGGGETLVVKYTFIIFCKSFVKHVFESVHSLRNENIEFRKLGESRQSSRQPSRSSSRLTLPPSAIQGLLETLTLIGSPGG